MTRGATTQVRTWVYDANQKLVSETLPESGTRTFGYDSAGRLAWKKDAKNQKIAFEYDTYDRVTVVKRYPVDGGAEDAAQRVTMAYDGTTGNSKGRLKEAQYGFGWTEAYTYTNAGLPLTKALTWPSTSGAGILTLTAEYDNEGRRTSLRYPTHYTSGTYGANNGRKLIYGFDSVGRLSTVNQETGGALISAINYNAASQVTSWTRAWDTNPSASETFDFNAAGQLTRQKLLNPSTLVDVEYRYSASNNDGRLWQRKNWVSGEEVTYQYDQLGRLSTAATTSTAWGLSWAFDGFGNRLQQSVTKGSAPVHSVAVDGLTNRMVGQSYDANGNMLITGLSYDVDNRLAADGVYSYRYSSTNQRIRVEGASGVFAWFYGFEGEMLAVYKHEKQGGDANRTWPVLQADKERVYAMGRLLRMGTQDVVVDRGASVIRHGTANLAYYPYGEEQGGASANDRAKYATYTRDASTGLDYAWNRMYKVEWGRFTTPDPYQASGGAANPASWNQNSYVENDPANKIDRRGLFSEPSCGGDGGLCHMVTDILAGGFMISEFGYVSSGGGGGSDFVDASKGLPPSVGGTLGGLIPLLPILLPSMPGWNEGYDDDPIRVTRLAIGPDCWSDKPHSQTNAPYRATTFVAYNDGTSLAGDSSVLIRERVTTSPQRDGTLATGVIGSPNSVGRNGVFNDEKGLMKLDEGPINLYQSFEVSVAGSAFVPVNVDLGARGNRGTLGVYFTWTHASFSDWLQGKKDFNVFVEGVGKDAIPLCK